MHITKGYADRSQQTLCGEPMVSAQRYLTRAEARGRALREGNIWNPKDVCEKCMTELAVETMDKTNLYLPLIIIGANDTGCHAENCHGRTTVAAPIRKIELVRFSELKTCKWDDERLARVYNAYEHDDGWSVEGFSHKLWLSLKCTQCGYDWSINKLGFPREY